MRHFIREELLTDPRIGRTQTAGEWVKGFASRIKEAARIAKAEEPGEFRGGDPEEIRLKKEEKQAEMGEMEESGEAQGGEEPDSADVEEAQQEEADKEAEKAIATSQPIGAAEVSPWPPNTTDYPPRDRNGYPLYDALDFHFRGQKQPWIEVGPPRQGPNQKKPWSEVLGLPPAMAPAGPPYWRQKLRFERREELGLNPRPNPYAAQPVAKALDDLLKKATEAEGRGPVRPSGGITFLASTGQEMAGYATGRTIQQSGKTRYQVRDKQGRIWNIEKDQLRSGRLPGVYGVPSEPEATKPEPFSRPKRNLVPCPYGGGIECMRHGGDGAEAHYPSYHHEHEGQPLSHEDLLHQEAEKSSGERTHALGSSDQAALVGHAMSGYENADLDNPDIRSKYMKTLRHTHRYLGSDEEANAWRRKAASEWNSVRERYHGPEDKPDGHLSMEAMQKDVKVTAKIEWGKEISSKESDIPEHLLDTIFGKKIGISDFEKMYRVDHPEYGANIHAIHINDLGKGRYEVVVKGAIDHHHEQGSEQAASFVRAFNCILGAGKAKGKSQISVHHDKLFMEAKHQKSGIGTQFIRNSVSEYPKWGVTEITTDPHWVGKYTWARMGFQWKDEDAAEAVRGFLPEFLMTHYGMKEEVAANLADRVADDPSKLACLKSRRPRLTEDGESLFQAFDRKEYRCSPEEIGKAFLLSDFGDQAWSGGGRVDMSKKTSPSYRQLKKYLGLK